MWHKRRTHGRGGWKGGWPVLKLEAVEVSRVEGSLALLQTLEPAFGMLHDT